MAAQLDRYNADPLDPGKLEATAIELAQVRVRMVAVRKMVALPITSCTSGQLCVDKLVLMSNIVDY